MAKSKHLKSAGDQRKHALVLVLARTRVPEQISNAEQNELANCEEVIASGLQTFFEVGQCLAHIRDRRLYRREFATFEEYCRRRWDMSKIHAYRLLHGAAVRSELSRQGISPLPDAESQVRPLTNLPAKQQSQAWIRAVERAKDHRVTAKLVHESVCEIGRCSGGAKRHAEAKTTWQVRALAIWKKVGDTIRSGNRRGMLIDLEKLKLIADPDLAVPEREDSAVEL